MNYVIAIDLDETLLDSKKKVSQFTIDILKEYKDKGNIVVVSSARGYGSCKDVAQLISADYVCCQSGNMIVDNKGNVIYENGFPKDELGRFLDLARKNTNNIVVDSDTNLYGGIDDDFARSWGIIHCETEELYSKKVYKMCVFYDDSYKQVLENYCKEHNYVCREMRGMNFLLITPPNSDKFYALEKLLPIVNSNLEHLIVFGDDTSDLLSIEKAKYGVAVANAKEAVLKVAKQITKSNDEDGVAYYLKNMFHI